MYINTQYIFDHFTSVQLKVLREKDNDTQRDREWQTDRDTSHCVNRRFMSEVRKISGQKCKQAASWQLLLEQVINIHEKNNSLYWPLRELVTLTCPHTLFPRSSNRSVRICCCLLFQFGFLSTSCFSLTHQRCSAMQHYHFQLVAPCQKPKQSR